MRYPGGKNGAGVYHKLINLMPPHSAYIEPFLGSGAVMRMKRPAIVNIGVDVSRDAIRQFERWAIDTRQKERYRLENRKAGEFLAGYRYTGSELIYCDPPYLAETRRSQKAIYEHEMMGADDHRELLRILWTLPCMVMISGYHSDLYERELAGWHTFSFQAMTRGGKLATEYVWMNFPEPIALHDYRYLGENFRERERITRKTKRWVSRLERMPLLERRALLDAIRRVLGSDIAVSGDSAGTIARSGVGGPRRQKRRWSTSPDQEKLF